MVDRLADRALNRVSVRPPYHFPPEVAALHRELPVVDLLVATPLFRRDVLARRRTGHVDLPRLVEAGVRLVGFSLATRFPDRRGTLSAPHFWSLGLPRSALRRDMAIAHALIGRIERWEGDSGGRLRLVRTSADLDRLASEPGVVGAFIGVQGGHVLEGRLENVAALHARGVRMLALSHVMDNELAGSNTGRRRGGLTGFGREVVGELERVGIVVDLAHASPAAIREAVPLLRRPFFVSHTGFRRLSGRRSRILRYSPATRNLSDEDARLVAEAGGVIGITCSSLLLGGDGVHDVIRAFRHAAELVGVEHVALGSDFDGALRMVFDVTGLPLLTEGLLRAGFDRADLGLMLGGNALRVLRAVMVAPA